MRCDDRRRSGVGLRRGWLLSAVASLSCGASPLPEDPYVAQVTQAARAERGNRYGEAAELYERAAGMTADEMVSRSALYRAGQAAERAGEAERALRTYLDLADRFPGTPEAGRGLYDAAMLSRRLGRDDDAVVLLRRLIRDEPEAALAEVGVRRLFQVYEDRGDLPLLDGVLGEEIAAGGDGFLVAVLYHFRALARAEMDRVDEAFADLEAGLARCPYPRCAFWDDLRWHGARIASEAGDHGRALEWIDRLLALREECWFNGTYASAFYDDAQRMKAEILRDDVGEPEAAAAAFLELRGFTDSVLRDDGLYEAALVYLDRLGDAERGCGALRDLLGEYPDSNWTRRARERLASDCR